jgi:hypothetical protein
LTFTLIGRKILDGPAVVELSTLASAQAVPSTLFPHSALSSGVADISYKAKYMLSLSKRCAALMADRVVAKERKRE